MRPIVLTILDGWGYSEQKIGNAILHAQKPNLDSILHNYPSTLLQASGQAVGMIWGEPGNSEVGHLTLGAGRTIFQYLSRINKAIESNDFYDNQAFIQVTDYVNKNNSKLHLVGLLTSGSVHAYFNHLIALLDLATKKNIPDTRIHLFTDGKDSGLKEAVLLLKKLNPYINKYPKIKLATIIGRKYPMDRNEHWDLTEKAYNLLTKGAGEETADPIKTIENYYSQEIYDAEIPPIIVNKEGIIRQGDGIIFFNFREDSMRQITRAFVDTDMDVFARDKVYDLMAVQMVPYLEEADILTAFPAPQVKNCLAEMLSNYGKKQFHIAETDKYAHVTYFFNCLKNKPFKEETDFFIKSTRKPETEPELMAKEILEKTTEELGKDTYDFMVINFANADLTAHVGNLDQTIKGVEVIDLCIGKLKDAVLAKDGVLIITADHGNAESVTYRSGEAETRHNLNPVPFFMVVREYEQKRTDEEIAQSLSGPSGIITDVAPTILEIMGIPKPTEMTGESLFGKLN